MTTMKIKLYLTYALNFTSMPMTTSHVMMRIYRSQIKKYISDLCHLFPGILKINVCISGCFVFLKFICLNV